MIAKCPNCAVLLECEQQPGELVDCANCGNTFELPRVSAAPNAFAKPVSSPPSPRDVIVKKYPAMLSDEPSRKLGRSLLLKLASIVAVSITTGVSLCAIYITMNDAKLRSDIAKEVRSGKYVVVNDAGNPCATMGFDSNGPTMQFIDDAGKDRVSLHVDSGGTDLTMFGASGKQRLTFGVDDNSSSLSIYQHDEARVMLLTTEKIIGTVN